MCVLCVCVIADDVHVPIVLLVVDGGDNTLETVLQALRVSTPVVVIGSSGRAANFIEAGMRLTKHKVYVDIVVIDLRYFICYIDKYVV